MGAIYLSIMNLPRRLRFNPLYMLTLTRDFQEVTRRISRRKRKMDMHAFRHYLVFVVLKSDCLAPTLSSKC